MSSSLVRLPARVKEIFCSQELEHLHYHKISISIHVTNELKMRVADYACQAPNIHSCVGGGGGVGEGSSAKLQSLAWEMLKSWRQEKSSVGEGACDGEGIDVVQLDISCGAACVNREVTVLELPLEASFGSGCRSRLPQSFSSPSPSACDATVFVPAHEITMDAETTTAEAEQ
jgi:hypothetical protein